MVPDGVLTASIVAPMADVGERTKAMERCVEETLIVVGLLVTPSVDGVLQDIVDILSRFE